MKLSIRKTCSVLVAVVMLLGVVLPVYATNDINDPGYEVEIFQHEDTIVRVGDSLYLAVAANMFFNATEILIRFEQEKLSYDSIFIGEDNLSVTETSDGCVKLIDYGSHAATPVYVLKFDISDSLASTPDTPATVMFTVLEAGFGTIETAADQNLFPATLPETPLTIVVRPALVDISYNDTEYYIPFDSIEKGEDLVFYPELSTGAYYDYELPVVTIDGNTVPVIPTNDGGWKVENVSGDVVIANASRAPKSYGKVVYNDVQDSPVITGKTINAVYLSDVSFTVPANASATENTKGHEYNVTANIGGISYTLSAPAVDASGNRTYTIPGTDVKGAVVITVTKTELAATKYTVSIGGSASADAILDGAVAPGASVQVDTSGNVSLELTVGINEGLNKGYIFVVKIDGVEVDLDKDGCALIENITSDVHVEIDKILNVAGVANVVTINGQEKNYLTLNGQNMWLIQMPNHVQNSETANYKYAGQEMYWSADHNRFVCVVIGTEKPSIDISQFELVSVAKTQCIASNDWDVNKSGDLDANDAQLIWNMYNNQYSGFDDKVTPEKFMLADANHDGVLDTRDASVIINLLKSSLVGK